MTKMKGFFIFLKVQGRPARDPRNLMKALLLVIWLSITSEVFAATHIVVPCYNEELRLPVDKYASFFDDPSNVNIHFAFVNDGSSDGTLNLIESIAQRYPHSVSVVNMVKNVGKAEAVRKGMQHVIRTKDLNEQDVVGFWDADLATPLDTIPKFIKLFDERPHLEMVFGARVALLGRDIHRKLDRHYLGRIFATLASNVLNLRIYDTQCGAKLFRATSELRGALEASFATGWIFDVELIARLITRRSAAGRPAIEDVIYEYPLEKWSDIAGSKLSFSAKVSALYGLLAIWAEYFGPGLATTLAAAAVTAAAILSTAAIFCLRRGRGALRPSTVSKGRRG
jgi:dolichyl-phosphate beta-glucosyltransferase